MVIHLERFVLDVRAHSELLQPLFRHPVAIAFGFLVLFLYRLSLINLSSYLHHLQVEIGAAYRAEYTANLARFADVLPDVANSAVRTGSICELPVFLLRHALCYQLLPM